MAHRQVRDGGAPSQRQLRVGEVIRRALSDLFMRGETFEPELDGVSITVSEVRVTPDLRHATAYVLPLGGVHAEETLAALNRARGPLRREVTRAINLKFSPELKFVRDDSFDRMDETRRMLNQPRVRHDVEDGGGD